MSNSKSEDTLTNIFKDIRVFNPDTLLEDMLNAKEGTVFMLGEKRISNHEGDDTVEQTFVQIKKARDTPTPEPPQGTLKESGNLNTSEEHVKDTSLYDTEAENWLLELLIDYSGMDFCGAEECLSWQACREFMAEVENHIAQQRAKLFELIRSEVLNTVVEDDKIEAWKNGELLKILQDFTK